MLKLDTRRKAYIHSTTTLLTHSDSKISPRTIISQINTGPWTRCTSVIAVAALNPRILVSLIMMNSLQHQTPAGNLQPSFNNLLTRKIRDDMVLCPIRVGDGHRLLDETVGFELCVLL
jgi:hypothetical protein